MSVEYGGIHSSFEDDNPYKARQEIFLCYHSYLLSGTDT